MKRRIENGVTILSTGDAKGGLKNKHGHAGISFDKKMEKYRAEINYKRKKYFLGYFTEVNDAIKMRKEAEYHVKTGDFEDWWKYTRIKKEL